MRSIRKLSWLVGAGVSLAVGCTPEVATVSGTNAAALTDEASVASYDTAWAYATVDPLGVAVYSASPGSNAELNSPNTSNTVDVNTAASQAAAAANHYFTPSGCVQAVAASNVVTYTLNGCVGPLDLIGNTGTLTATFTEATGGGLQVKLTSDNLVVNGVGFNVNATGVATANGNTRSLSLNSSTTTTGANANARSSQSTTDWTMGSGCITLNSTGTRNFNNTDYKTAIANYAQCAAQCPSKGTLTITGANGTSTVTFNGDSTPSATTADGQKGTIAIPCG